MSFRISAARSIIVVGAAVAFAACQESPTASPEQGAALAKAPAVTNTPMVWTLGTSGGLQTDGQGDYIDGACGVAAVLQNVSGSKDATINLTSAKNCGRAMKVTYPDGSSQTKRVFVNLLALELTSIPQGTTQPRRLNIGSGLYDASDACDGIRFGSLPDSSETVNVYRASATEWQVTSPPGARALCVKQAKVFVNPVSFTVRLK